MPARKTKVVDKQSNQPRRSRDHGGHGQIPEAIEELASEMEGVAHADTEIIQEIGQLLAHLGHRFRESLRSWLDAWLDGGGNGVPPMTETPNEPTERLKKRLKNWWSKATAEEQRELLLELDPLQREQMVDLLGSLRAAEYDALIFGDGAKSIARFNAFLKRVQGVKLQDSERQRYAQAITMTLKERFSAASLYFIDEQDQEIPCRLSTHTGNAGANRYFRIRDCGSGQTNLWTRATLPRLVIK